MRHKKASIIAIMKSTASATEQLRIRVPAARARRVRRILGNLGTDTGSLVNMLFVQVIRQNAIPFRVTNADRETEEILNNPAAMAAIRAYEAGKAGPWYTHEEVFGE